MRLLGYHKAYIYIYICYFIKSAVRIPNTTCIRSISMTGLGLVGLMGLWQNSSHTSHHINISATNRLHQTLFSLASRYRSYPQLHPPKNGITQCFQKAPNQLITLRMGVVCVWAKKLSKDMELEEKRVKKTKRNV